MVSLTVIAERALYPTLKRKPISTNARGNGSPAKVFPVQNHPPCPCGCQVLRFSILYALQGVLLHVARAHFRVAGFTHLSAPVTRSPAGGVPTPVSSSGAQGIAGVVDLTWVVDPPGGLPPRLKPVEQRALGEPA